MICFILMLMNPSCVYWCIICIDGAFDLDAIETVSQSAQKSSTSSHVRTDKTAAADKGQLEVLLSQLAVGSFKVVENKGKSSLIVLLK
jgi:hypothetical protein